eukprot:1195180-Prorocentrum_minimum.AAC.1
MTKRKNNENNERPASEAATRHDNTPPSPDTTLRRSGSGRGKAEHKAEPLAGGTRAYSRSIFQGSEPIARLWSRARARPSGPAAFLGLFRFRAQRGGGEFQVVKHTRLEDGSRTPVQP